LGAILYTFCCAAHMPEPDEEIDEDGELKRLASGRPLLRHHK